MHIYMCVVVCTDVLGKERHRQVGVGVVVTSGNLGHVMVSALAWKARDAGSIPSLGTIFSTFIITTALGP